jgi:hypothetical protein
MLLISSKRRCCGECSLDPVGRSGMASGSLDRYLDEPRTGPPCWSKCRQAGGIDAVGAERVRLPGPRSNHLCWTALLRSGDCVPPTGRPCSARPPHRGPYADCADPEIAAPMRADTALAYSCNKLLQWLGPRSVSRLASWRGVEARQGSQRVRSANPSLQRLGEDVRARSLAMDLAMAYRSLALQLDRARECSLVGRGARGARPSTARASMRVRAGCEGPPARPVSTAKRTRRTDRLVRRLPAQPRTAGSESRVMMRGRSGGIDAAPV